MVFPGISIVLVVISLHIPSQLYIPSRQRSLSFPSQTVPLFAVVWQVFVAELHEHFSLNFQHVHQLHSLSEVQLLPATQLFPQLLLRHSLLLVHVALHVSKSQLLHVLTSQLHQTTSLQSTRFLLLSHPTTHVHLFAVQSVQEFIHQHAAQTLHALCVAKITSSRSGVAHIYPCCRAYIPMQNNTTETIPTYICRS